MRRASFAIAGLALVAAFVSSCIRYRPRPLAPQVSADSLSALSLAEAARRVVPPRELAAGWPPTKWDLASLTVVALHASPVVDVAFAEWTTARAGIRVAGGRGEVTADGDVERVSNSLDPSPWIWGAVLALPLDPFGRRGARIGEAERRSDAARLRVGSAAWAVRASVRSALLDLWRQERGAELAAVQVQLRADIVEILETRLAAGAASIPDVSVERVRLREAAGAAGRAQRAAALARVDLAAAVGVPAHEIHPGDAVFPESSIDSLPDERDLRAVALLSRTDVLAALADYESADAALRLEVVRQYPGIALGPGYTFEKGERRIQLAPAFSLPLDGNRGGIADAEARRAESGARFRQLQAEVLAELSRARADLAASRAILASADQAVADAQRTFDAVQAGFDVGREDRLALTEARLEATLAQAARLDAAVGVAEALGRLEDALQRPLVGDTAPLDIPEAWTAKRSP